MIERLTSADLTVLASIPLLADLRADEINAITVDAMVRSYDEDSLLFSAGDPAEHFFAIVKGFVRLFALNEHGYESIIDIVDAGSAFAEAAIFASARYPVNAEVMGGTRIIFVPASTLVRLLREDSELGLRILNSLHKWQSRLMSEILQLKRRSPTQRLALFLVSMIESTSGPVTVMLPYRKGVIAGRLGITPESLSRALARIKGLGVESCGDEVRIDDVAVLRRFCKGLP